MNSKAFDYIAGKTTGPLAAAEASLEHTAGYLGEVLAENERLLSGIKRAADYLDEGRIGDASFILEALQAK